MILKRHFDKAYIDISSFYEGHTMDLVTFATRVCKILGVETIIGRCRRLESLSESRL